MKSLVKKASQPVTEEHTESYASLNYVRHATGQCDPGVYDYVPYDFPLSPPAPPSITQRELPEIPSDDKKTENAGSYDDDDDDDNGGLYSRILDPVSSPPPSGPCSDPPAAATPTPTPSDGNEYEYPTTGQQSEAPAPADTEKLQACDDELYEDTVIMVQEIQRSETEEHYISQTSDGDHYEDMDPCANNDNDDPDSDDESDVYTHPDFKGTNSSTEEDTGEDEERYASIDDIDGATSEAAPLKDDQIEEGGYTCVRDVPANASIDDDGKTTGNMTEIRDSFEIRPRVSSAHKPRSRSMSLTDLEERLLQQEEELQQQQQQELQQQQQQELQQQQQQELQQQQQQQNEMQQQQPDASNEQLNILMQRMEEMQQALMQLQSTTYSQLSPRTTPDATSHPEPQLHFPPPVPSSSRPKLRHIGFASDDASEQHPTSRGDESRSGEKSEVTPNPTAKTSYTAKAAVTIQTTKRKMKEVLRKLVSIYV